MQESDNSRLTGADINISTVHSCVTSISWCFDSIKYSGELCVYIYMCVYVRVCVRVRVCVCACVRVCAETQDG
jgi:hypothetical protein